MPRRQAHFAVAPAAQPNQSPAIPVKAGIRASCPRAPYQCAPALMPALPGMADDFTMRRKKNRYCPAGYRRRQAIQAAAALAASSVLLKSMAMVIGPMPPGTGVIASALPDTAS